MQRNVRSATNAADATSASVLAFWPLHHAAAFVAHSLAYIPAFVECVALDENHA